MTEANQRRTVPKLFILLAMLGVATLGAAVGWYMWAISPADEAGSEISFRVPKGATAGKPGGLLAEQDLISSKLAWKIYLKLNEAPAPKAGLHKVSAAMDIANLLDAMSGPPLIEDIDVTMVEGWRLRDADAALVAKGLIQPGAYKKAAESLDRFKIPFKVKGKSLAGYLLPDTYKVPAPDSKLEVDG